MSLPVRSLLSASAAVMSLVLAPGLAHADVIGAIVGGAVGSQFGKGNGKIASAAIGAVIGDRISGQGYGGGYNTGYGGGYGEVRHRGYGHGGYGHRGFGPGGGYDVYGAGGYGYGHHHHVQRIEYYGSPAVVYAQPQVVIVPTPVYGGNGSCVVPPGNYPDGVVCQPQGIPAPVSPPQPGAPGSIGPAPNQYRY